jgi:hypothetical protein
MLLATVLEKANAAQVNTEWRFDMAHKLAIAILVTAVMAASSFPVMAATTYTIEVSGDGVTGSIEITDNLNPLPGSDTWSAVTPVAFGVEGGNVASWGQHGASLHATGATPVLSLSGFTPNTKENETGDGEKHNMDGRIPAGQITWRCVLKR